MRQEAHKGDLALSLAKADLAVVPPVLEAGKIAEDALLNVPNLIAEANAAGGDTRSIESVDEIVSWVASEAKEGDLVAVLSNGGFGGIHTKLLDALKG